MPTKQSRMLSRVESPQRILGRLRGALDRIQDIFTDEDGLAGFDGRDFMTLTEAERGDLQTELYRLHREMGKAIRAIRKAIAAGLDRELVNLVSPTDLERIERWILNRRLLSQRTILRRAGLERGIPVWKKATGQKREPLEQLRTKIYELSAQGLSLRKTYATLCTEAPELVAPDPAKTRKSPPGVMTWRAFLRKVTKYELVPSAFPDRAKPEDVATPKQLS